MSNMDWIAFGTYDVDAHPRVAALIDGVRAHGHHLDEVNEPLGLDTAARVRLLHQPWRLPGLGYRLARCWLRLARRARRRPGPAPQVVLVGYLGHFDVLLARARYRRSTVVLDHLVSAAGTAADRRMTGRSRLALLRALDRLALSRADIVVVDTDAHRAALPAPRPSRPRTVVTCPVGATQDWFAAAGTAPPRAGGPLRVIFFGLFTPLQGVPVVAAAAALLADRPDIVITLVGKGQDHAAARLAAGRAPVRWLDWVPARQLPALVAAQDVCLGIFGAGGKSRTVVPTKVYQGAAAGCAIVTSDTPPQRHALGDAARFVAPGDPTALATALRELAADRPAVEKLRAAARTRALDRFTPHAVTADLVAAVQDAQAGRSPKARASFARI
jgi:glycosyltransferase involved in cell wall biosynthesis